MNELLELRERIALLERALKQLRDEKALLESEIASLRANDVSGVPSLKRATQGKRRKAMSAAWLSLLGHIADKGEDGATIDAIQEAVKQRGLGIQRRAIRAQLSNYKSRNLIEHIGDARYRLTKFGRITLNHEKDSRQKQD